MGTKFAEPKPQRAAVAAEIQLRMARRDDVGAILQWLVIDHGFTWANGQEPARLRGLGVSCSCTCGPRGLLSNWCAAVERKDGAAHA